MTQDISHVLQGWDFDPHELNVRVVTGSDGCPKLQMRIDLGMLQMAMDGRPDGRRPENCASLLDYFETQAREYGKGYKLNSESADDLFREGWQFYHRYLCLFHVGHFEPVIRDTERNLRLFDFVRRHAGKKRDIWRFDQYRPYVLMMNVRARAMLTLQGENKTEALAEIERGRERIIEFLNAYGRSTDESECFELDFLRRWRDELCAADDDGLESETTEADDTAKLRVHLQQAIDREDYEYATLLRDQIKRLEQTGDQPEE